MNRSRAHPAAEARGHQLQPAHKQPQANLPAGAYDPYDRERTDGERRREATRRRIDLRRLSEWIKAMQKAKVLKQENSGAAPKPKKRRRK
jgi:hypothetical protein